MMRASDVSPRMFDNDFLDFFSRTHWLVVPILWLPISAALCWWASSKGIGAPEIAGTYVAGVLLWSVSEYWLHRTLFHWIPETWWGPKLHFLLHGVHHQWHQDPYRLVMPPAISLTLGAIFYGIIAAVAWVASLLGVPTGWEIGTFAGFILGYVTYDCTHYYVHHFRPTSKYMKRLRAHHMNHHHNDPDRKFGVSTMVWDRVFGTL
jgi:sterol desaturase/sphingolipid hydroxylase (fatty acid hydroxylase superfamily)